MIKKKVLFICARNSARSQMAEAFFNRICDDPFEAHSAGLDPGQLNPFAVEVMREAGIDISRNKTKAVFDYVRAGMAFMYIITVCDQSRSERCPIFPGITTRLHWSFTDPATFRGSPEEKLAGTRAVRDAIQTHVETWYTEVSRALAA